MRALLALNSAEKRSLLSFLKGPENGCCCCADVGDKYGPLLLLLPAKLAAADVDNGGGRPETPLEKSKNYRGLRRTIRNYYSLGSLSLIHLC